MTRNRTPSTILVCLLALLFLSPSVLAAVNYLEDFDDEGVGDNPDEDFYDGASSGSGTFGVTSAQSVSIPNSMRIDPLAGTGSYTYTFPRVDFCDGGDISFAFRIAALPASAVRHFSLLVGGAAAMQADMTIDSGGTPQITVGASTGTLLDVTVAVDTWYNVTLTPSCTEVKVTMSFDDQGAFTNADSTGSVNTDYTTPDTLTVYGVGAANPASLHMDNLRLNQVNPIPDLSAAAATAAVTNMVGFDVDPSGNSLLARTDNGEFIRAFNPVDLSLLDTEDTDCDGRFEMVSAVRQFVAYVACDGTQTPETIRIRTPTLGSPNFGPSCANSNVCPPDVDIDVVGCGGFDPSNYKELRTFDLSPWDYSKVYDQSGFFLPFANQHAIAWTFTTSSNGQYGVNEYTALDDPLLCDARFEEVANLGSVSDIDQVCSWTATDGRHLIAVADAVTTPVVHEWVEGTSTHEDEQVLDGQLGAGVGYGGAIGAKGVACAQDRIAFLGSNEVRIFNVTTGAQTNLRLTTAPVTQTKGIHLSGSGQFVAYTDNTEVRVMALSNSTVVARATIPAGTFRGVYLSYNAQNLWIGTSTTIARYRISHLTTGNATCDLENCNPTGPTTPAPGGVGDAFGPLADSFRSLFGAGGDFVLGLFLMLFMAGLGFLVFGGAKKIRNREPIGNGPVIGAGAFAACQFFINGAMGLFSPLLIFGVIGAIILLVGGIKALGSRA